MVHKEYVFCCYVPLASVILGSFPKRLVKPSWPLKLRNSSPPVSVQQGGWAVPQALCPASWRPFQICGHLLFPPRWVGRGGARVGFRYNSEGQVRKITHWKEHSQCLGGSSHWWPLSKWHAAAVSTSKWISKNPKPDTKFVWQLSTGTSGLKSRNSRPSQQQGKDTSLSCRIQRFAF